jgi:nicotinate-nucleotide--dimethylbenzimidazole phosphoribosyltransferase
MTKDEDDWLSDFLEAAQASAKQNQAAAEKDYASKLRLLTPRFTRASACDPDAELAKRLAASEALAGQKKFDAASDALDEAYVLSAGMLSAAAAAAMAEAAASAEPPAEEATAAGLEEPGVPPAAEGVADENAGLDDAFAEFAEADESAPAEEAPEPPAAPEETPAETSPDDLEASFDDVFADLASADEPAAAEEPGAGDAASGEDSAAEEKS